MTVLNSARAIAAYLIVLCVGVARVGAESPVEKFWRHWGDGKAEVSTFRLTQPRYGALRAGTLTMIFVTEDFSEALRVKADPGKHATNDVYSVLKLNSVKSFQTGIYAYHVMTSAFVKFADGGALAKVSFSAQEWCGQVFMEWLPRGAELVGTLHSYFDGEADRELRLPFVAGTITEEQVPYIVRGLGGIAIAPGGDAHVSLVPSLEKTRLLHQPPVVIEAVIHRGVTRPAATAIGTIPVENVTVTMGAEAVEWQIESNWPHRIVGYKSSTGEAATLVATERVAYWTLNHPLDERELLPLHLTPVPTPTN